VDAQFQADEATPKTVGVVKPILGLCSLELAGRGRQGATV
jgi:hypothetical protein